MYGFHAEALFNLKPKDISKVNEHSLPSSWIYIPYFLLYFVAYILNTLVWPVLLFEHSCVTNYNNETFKGTLECLNEKLNATSAHDFISTPVISTMILACIGSAILSLFSYFLIWKMALNKNHYIAILLPPVCLLVQCFLQAFALKYKTEAYFKIIIAVAAGMPSFHANFQGVFLLFLKLKAPHKKSHFKQKKFSNATLETSYCTIYGAMIIAGFLIGTAMDVSYSIVFIMQSIMTCLCCIYGILMLPNKCKCDIESEKSPITSDVDGSDSDTSIDDTDSLTSSEEQRLENLAKIKQDNGLLSSKKDIFVEAPLIFSEVSYHKELVVIIEIMIFTVAIIADSAISGSYLMLEPFQLDLREYGYCISLQGLSRLFGYLLTKTCIYFKGVKHSSLILIASTNYVIYYIALGVAKTKGVAYFAMILNVFGGVAIPTIASFIMLNFNDTLPVVLELSAISSLIVALGFSSLEYFVYIKTIHFFPGAIFLLTAAMIVVGFVVALGTFFSTTVKNRRRTKEFADTLLNDYE